MFQLSEDDLLPFLLNDNKTIITTVTNSGYLFYTLNMLKSLKQYILKMKSILLDLNRKYQIVKTKVIHLQTNSYNKQAKLRLIV